MKYIYPKTTPKNYFIRFLKNNDIFFRYMKNATSRNTISFYWAFGINVFTKVTPIEYVDAAFSWEHAKEGFDYWDEIHSKWLKYMKVG